MSSLLLEKDLRASKDDSEVRILARARTLTVLERVDSSRKEHIIRFLIGANLVQSAKERAPVIGLGGADLHGSDLSGFNLSGADLRYSDLRNSDLSDADLKDAIGITNWSLWEETNILYNATMPNGQKYEDWVIGR